MAPIRKRLEGVTATAKLWSVYDECLAIYQKGETKPLLTSVSSTEDSEAASPSNATTTSRHTNAAAASLLLRPPSWEEARTTVANFQEQIKQKRKRPKILPISLIRAMQVLLEHTTNDDADAAAAATKVEKALCSSDNVQLEFTPAQKAPDSPAKKKFRDRMERLRLQNEESKYYKITRNIGNNPAKDDDITTKSMTYAASVGLNLIVAPISFGVFMFFFSGPILKFLWRNYEAPTHSGAVDIRKVIIGVISGVAMLFIEMLLFIIRTHELERGMRKKMKKKGTAIKPFGEYSSKSKKEYKSE